MYLGKIVELTPRDDLYEYAQHPYTKAHLSAVSIPDPLIAKKARQFCLKEMIYRKNIKECCKGLDDS